MENYANFNGRCLDKNLILEKPATDMDMKYQELLHWFDLIVIHVE